VGKHHRTGVISLRYDHAMSIITRNPVAAMTTVLAVLTAVYGVLATTDVVPEKIVGYIAFGIAVLAAILGAITHQKVTPLVNPKNNDGVPLVAVRSGGRV
jgi:hypothetical protein